MSTNANDPLYFVEDSCIAEYERTVVSIAQRRVIKYLWANGRRSLTEITSEMHISLNALAAVYLKLAPHGVIERNDDGLQLTPSGRLWIIRNRKFLFMTPVQIIYEHAPVIEFKVSTSGKGTLPPSYRLKLDKS
jgi:hypothetical protein